MVQTSRKQNKLIFAFTLYPDRSSEINALLLTESIRTFAGSLSKSPIWCLVPECGAQLSSTMKERLQRLNASLMPFTISSETLQFPFAGEPYASALAESEAKGQAGLLAWLGTNTVVLQEPGAFILQSGKDLGYRPVHITLVGSSYDQPIDRFWTLIYERCNVPKGRVFPMITHVDATRIRPYFNAGCLITRPERQLLQNWRDRFFKLYREPSFKRFYQENELYTIFMHQAVLAGVVLSSFASEEIQELPKTYNYPLHLHAQDITNDRPSSIEDLVTIRHEGFYEDPDWKKKLPAKAALKKWIAQRLL